MGTTRMKIILCSAVVGLCITLFVGCAELKSLGKGAVAGITQSGKEGAKERVAAEDRIPAEVKPLVDGIIDQIPESPLPEPPASAPEQAVWFTVGMFLAKILGDTLKGYVRGKMADKEDKA